VKSNNLTALATAVIAFVTVLGSVSALYYNLRLVGIPLLTIMFFELLFLAIVVLFIWWVKKRGEM